MHHRYLHYYALLLILLCSFSTHVWADTQKNKPLVLSGQLTTPDPKKAALGAKLFHDTSLSEPEGQSCASCHIAEHAFSDKPNASSEGAIKGIFGARNTPTLSYIAYTPAFAYNRWGLDLFSGGQFWDGRVDTLAEQAIHPLLSAIEMNNQPEALVKKIRTLAYNKQIINVYGKTAFDNDTALLNAVADALAHFQRTEIFQPFTSKYDYVIQGLATFSAQELQGKDLFENKGACARCHQGNIDGKEIFTNYTYHNIGVPSNTALLFFKQETRINPKGKNFVDEGLELNRSSVIPDYYQGHLRGLFKTPTLRNIELTAPYMHNGVFKTLREAISVYHSGIDRKRLPLEIDENPSELLPGGLELSEVEIDALVAFMKTLTDGYLLK